jgi:hypothetical protein
VGTYRYNESPVIKEVAFKKTGNGAIRAYLSACPDAGSEVLQGVLSHLQQSGFECIPYTFDGKPALEVRGFRNDAHLITGLVDGGFIKGKADVQLDKNDQISWLDKLKTRSLQASGVAMAIADIGFIVYGMKEAEIHRRFGSNNKRDFSEALAGFCYLAGSTTLTMYGRNDQSQLQIREMAETILKNAKERGFDVPDDSVVSDIGKKRDEGLMAKVNNLFKKYPSEIGNMCYFGAGAFIAQSAMRNRVLKGLPGGGTDWGGVGDTALGSTTMLAGAIATFMKEKAHDPDDKKETGIKGGIEWLKSNPLSTAGMLYIGSTLCHAFTTYFDTQRSRNIVKAGGAATEQGQIAKFKLEAIPWRIMFVGATLVGEVLLSISSKGHGDGVVSDNTVNSSIIAMSADLIAKQPDHRQDALIDYMAGFLGRSDVLAMKGEEACKLLRQEVEALRKNPWVGASKSYDSKSYDQQQGNEAAAPLADATSHSRRMDKPLPAWQSKVAASEPSAGVTPSTSL